MALEHDSELVEALNNLAWLLATAPDDSIRNGPEAVRFAETACRLTSYRQTLLVGTLASAYAEAGRFAEAVETARKACALAGESRDPGLLERNRELLAIYESGKAYHEPIPPAGGR
jgi:hypothetical protein